MRKINVFNHTENINMDEKKAQEVAWNYKTVAL